MKTYCYFLAFCTILASCHGKPADVGLVDAYVPVYGSAVGMSTIAQLPPQPIVNGGKIATKGVYLLQVEAGQGIHILDVSNPAVPVRISFIKIPGCSELTLKGNYLYSNNGKDLVTLDISQIDNITLSARVAEAFPNLIASAPPQSNVYFECPDSRKGTIIRWELKKVDNPKCRN